MRLESFRFLVPARLRSWVGSSPRTFFLIGITLLFLSLLFTVVQSVFFPAQKSATEARPPGALFSSGEKTRTEQAPRQQLQEKLTLQILSYRTRAQERRLTKEDSLKLNTLIAQYDSLTTAP